jgi:type II secretion system protein H
MKRSVRSRNRSAGFTLVELIVVIVILGILAAVAVPRFFSDRTFLERGYYEELAAALRYAQKLAVASGCPVRMSIDAAGYEARQQNAQSGSCDMADSTWSTGIALADGAERYDGVRRTRPHQPRRRPEHQRRPLCPDRQSRERVRPDAVAMRGDRSQRGSQSVFDVRTERLDERGLRGGRRRRVVIVLDDERAFAARERFQRGLILAELGERNVREHAAALTG